MAEVGGRNDFDAFLGFYVLVPPVGDGGAGEVEGAAFPVADDFDDVGVGDFGGVVDGAGEGGDGVFADAGDEAVDFFGVDGGFVSLEVEVEVGFDFFGDFGHAVSAGGVAGISHDGLATEVFDGAVDAFVVGGDEDALGFFATDGFFPDPLDEGLVPQEDEGFAGEAGGGVAGGNDEKGFHLAASAMIHCPASVRLAAV